ncbi:ATP-binding protein [Pedobacter cryophilus]|uniref:ATP-binding protein n=1 Tax=Pedobacter cryophilus TaxID=2571271 RepID=A0A4U1C370_9SPHI|nr:ATP-binding protein [Pedobacter cryophilus]TKB98746.1 ATP-binding protein [Pedobacter cryophilus]
MFQRSYLQQLTTRIKEPKKFIQVLMGPRQVGKTTLIGQLIKEINIPHQFESADAVPASDSVWLTSLWESVRIKIKNEGIEEFLLVIDEIQKIDNWSEIVKKLWDQDSRENINIKIILLGSSRLLLQQGLTESLAGRFESTYVGHWSFKEMQDAFGFTANQYVWFGAYPGSVSLINEEERWKNYINNSLIETSISKDILMLTRVDKPALMKRLFELGCLYSGQILSYTKVQGQLQDAGNTTTLSHYLQLLDTAGLLAGIEKYAADVIRKRSSSPKFQVHNNALISAQRNESFNEILENKQEWGRMVESAIGAHLVNSALVNNFNVYYWRHRNDEVDFVLEKRGRVIALEVKSNDATSLSGLNAFQKYFNPSKVLLIGNKGLPWEEFLKINPAEIF